MPETPTSATSSPAQAPVKRACDCCHKRKVKCIGDGTKPCKNCAAAGLTCTYNAVPQKKGPKGSRAKVISELRETQKQQLAHVPRPGFGIDAAQHQAAFARTPGLLPMDLITSCVDFFFTNVYPTQPIIHRSRVGETIGQMDSDIEAYCLVTSLCAYMCIQPNMISPGSLPSTPETEQPQQSTLPLGMTLLHEALRVRKGNDYIENPTIWSVITSFFFFGSYFCLDKHNTAWFHLREATTLAHVMGMHEEETYKQFDPIESSRRRRLYWLLFITERAYALQRHRPLTLYSTIELPRIDEEPSESVELSGFLSLVNLFKPFDDTFVGLWNKTRGGCTSEWLASLQNQLSDALPAYLQGTEVQAVDLQVSQQWLKTMVWQLSISHGFLSSNCTDNSMSLSYPIEISRELCQIAGRFSQQAMEVHGIGLVEKLFDIAYTLTDVMSCVPLEQYSFEIGPRDYLNQLTSLIAQLRGGNQRYFPLLAAKINETLPSSVPNPVFPLGPGDPTLSSAVNAHRLGLDDIYDTHSMSQPRSHGSNPTSHDSTPFGSPPRSSSLSLAAGAAHPPFNFEDLNMNVNTGGPVTSTGFIPTVCEASSFNPTTSAAMPGRSHMAPPRTTGAFHEGYRGQMPQGMKFEH